MKALVISFILLLMVAVFLFYSNKGLRTDLTAANAEIAGLTAAVAEMKGVVAAYAEAEKQAKEFEKELSNDTTDNLDVVPAEYILKQLHAD